MMKRHTIFGIAFFTGLLGAMLAGPVPEAPAQNVIKIKVADALPAGHVQVVEGLAPS
jgi:hypothetical protein